MTTAPLPVLQDLLDRQPEEIFRRQALKRLTELKGQVSGLARIDERGIEAAYG